MSDPVWTAFEADIPASEQNDVMQIMAEAVGGWSEHKAVHILNSDRHDAINVTAEGILTWNGKEYYFHLEDGNNNGTVLLAWEDHGQKFEYRKPTQWALEPNGDIIGKAIASGGGKFLLAKWDAFLTRPEVSEIPNKYSYDRHFQPGSKVETYWKSKAEKYGFVLVSKEQADETRASIKGASQ